MDPLAIVLPSAITWTTSHSLSTKSRLCSTISTVVPLATSSRIMSAIGP